MTNDWLEEAGDAASGGEARKQIELINRTFTLRSAVLHPFTDKKTGLPASSYIAVIRVDGESEDCECWLGGVRVMGQVATILERGLLPIRLFHGSVALTNGTAYNLELAGDVPTETVTTAPTHKAALAAYMKANGVKASDILRANEVMVSEGDDVAALWSDFVEKATVLGGINEEELCRQILSELQAQAQADASAIPFE